MWQVDIKIVPKEMFTHPQHGVTFNTKTLIELIIAVNFNWPAAKGDMLAKYLVELINNKVFCHTYIY